MIPSSKRTYTRKLGSYVPESRVELHAEKALFRNQTQLLRDLCDRQTKFSRRHPFQFPSEGSFNPIIQSILKRSGALQQMRQHEESHVTVDAKNNISPEVRWLLTRSARMQRVNNAGYSTFQNKIKDKVVSADGRKREFSLQRQRSMCLRTERSDTPLSQRLQCDVLGPKFCTDCTEIDQKKAVLRKQQARFPRIEVHTRSLVAPEKVEKIFLSHPNEMFHQQKRYACGCTYDPKLEITTPLVYTPHEVFQRIRRRKQLLYGDLMDDTFKTSSNNYDGTNSIPRKPTYYQEKTEPPMDMTVSVKFVNEGSVNTM
ncbi:uncharacterized protein LOC127851452 [Dreissena polymorpha]|uniref:Uncharacterized protein n=1 Tax=Dreissena polymorpha TaxID=45954 RepID=A0A9D4HX60_DREPO|nr:uncharacterized protein LOC127851452 [Dreissena polymorpha]KAH3738595.1 hypothetical protein DPMN_045233 [Dreissena polymorpha]